MLKRFSNIKWLLLVAIGFTAGAAFAFYPQHREDQHRKKANKNREQIRQQKEAKQSCSQPAPSAASLTANKTLPRQPHD
ncbi:MAG: hypothetical protein LCH51_12875 [Bacteroidetes bacterium]|nr:hypothetical protein [Bacteroidota bacterium]HOA38469.1 hypothetical protein [Flavihumibacter sp.]